MEPTVGSLFAGIGGLDLGLERAGFQTKWQVEIDDYARKVLQRHFPDAERFRDVRQFPPKPDSAWLLHRWKERFGIDLLCAGFPCQDISFAGKGAGLEGQKSRLFYEAVRVVRVLGPRFVLLENVAGLLTRGIDQVLGTLASIGYDAEWHCIPAAYLGAPHIRDRAFILAYSQSQRCRETGGHSKRSKKRPASGGQVLADCNCERRYISWETRQWEPEIGGGSCNVSDSESTGLEGFGDSTTITKGRSGERHPWTKVGKGWEWWSVEPEVGRMAYGVPDRVDQIRGLGNAVATYVAEFLGNQLYPLVKANL